jgi:hypothetical protein
MTPRPILFSAPMVRALLAGEKVQTRRILKPQPIGDDICVYLGSGCYGFAAPDGTHLSGDYNAKFDVGDVLWVRETWHGMLDWDRAKPSEMPMQYVRYAADDCISHSFGKKRPAIFMPRWASRLTLTVTDVRVQRLQDVSEEDARAEGVPCDFYEAAKLNGSGSPWRLGFAYLWNSINGDGAFEANPWAVAVTFTVDRRNVDEVVK